jgi:hypothetical protein
MREWALEHKMEDTKLKLQNEEGKVINLLKVMIARSLHCESEMVIEV